MMQGHLMLSGRSTEVVPIAHSEARRFVLAHHYSGRYPTGAMYRYGKVDDGLLVGVCVFGSPASPWVSVSAVGKMSQVLELQRLALSNNRKNEASWFVARCMKMLAYHFRGVLVSYADTGEGHHGGVYQALGFHYAGCSQARTDIASRGHARHHDGDPSERQQRTAKHRYWLSVPRGKFDDSCLWPSLPYPKPDEEREVTDE